ncbi:unnamed protein product [Soboliphyme baturini]|uniref:BZIP domain-containing protein n=1 Tax=Soboliphyme baturini TaxID=241478 RepID=A0A183J0K5_9BILA|nr:unnamed protein product [Soboliphyme baturini]
MFSMSAAELRQQLSRNKKVDKKSEAVSMKEKFRIAENL